MQKNSIQAEDEPIKKTIDYFIVFIYKLSIFLYILKLKEFIYFDFSDKFFKFIIFNFKSIFNKINSKNSNNTC